jgi:hypothetical protein
MLYGAPRNPRVVVGRPVHAACGRKGAIRGRRRPGGRRPLPTSLEMEVSPAEARKKPIGEAGAGLRVPAVQEELRGKAGWLKPRRRWGRHGWPWHYRRRRGKDLRAYGAGLRAPTVQGELRGKQRRPTMGTGGGGGGRPNDVTEERK